MINELQQEAIQQESETTIFTDGSFLVAEIGHTNTSVSLFDRIDGRYRFVANGSALTTAGTPWLDAGRGLQHAINQITLVTGRQFLDGHGGLIRPARQGYGIDNFGLVISIGEPLRIVIAGLLGDISVASARKVVQTMYATEVDCFSLEDTRNRPAQVLALLEHRPDVILLAGGTDGGADRRLMELVQTLAMSIDLLDRGERPIVIFAGNTKLRGRVDEVLGEYTNVLLAENVRPKFEVEYLDHAIALMSDLYLTQVFDGAGGLRAARDWASEHIRTADHSFVAIGEFLAARGGKRVICLDIGSDHATLADITSERVHLKIRPDLGLGSNATSMMFPDELTSMSVWLQPGENTDITRDWVNNKVLHPSTIPVTEQDFRLEMGLLQQTIRRISVEAGSEWGWPIEGVAPACEEILIRGSAITDSPRPVETLLALLNGLQPVGIFHIMADPAGVLPAMGLLSADNPEMVVELFDGEALESWGTVIVPKGSSRQGQTALSLTVSKADGKQEQYEVVSGEIYLLDLAEDESAEILLKPSSGFDLGEGRGKDRKLRPKGGRIGLIIDARGRPLSYKGDLTISQNQFHHWLQSLSRQ